MSSAILDIETRGGIEIVTLNRPDQLNAVSPELAQALLDEPPSVGGGSDHAQVLAALTQMAPSFSLRGGTREILRGMIARGLGLR